MICTTKAQFDRRPEGEALHPRLRAMSGLSLVELSISIVLLSMGLLAMSAVIFECAMLERATEERSKAIAETKEFFETVRQTNELDLVYRDNSTVTNVDLVNAVADISPGTLFEVDGLTATDDAATVGSVTFPEETLTRSLSLTTADLVNHGELTDEDGDGQVEISGLLNGSDLLPIKVVIAWEGVSGPTTIEVESLVTKR